MDLTCKYRYAILGAILVMLHACSGSDGGEETEVAEGTTVATKPGQVKAKGKAKATVDIAGGGSGGAASTENTAAAVATGITEAQTPPDPGASLVLDQSLGAPLSPTGINIANQAAYILSGSCGEGVTTVTATLTDSAAANATGDSPCTGGNYSVSLDASALVDGEIDVLVQGGGSQESSFKVVKDTVIPVLTGISDDLTPSSSKSFTAQCSELECEFAYVVDSEPTTEPASGFTTDGSIVVNTGDGTLYLHVVARDVVGNLSVVNHSQIEMDTTAPGSAEAFILISPASTFSQVGDINVEVGNLTVGDTIRLYEDNDCLQEIGSVVAASDTETFMYSFPANGDYVLSTTAEDDVGNVSNCSTNKINFRFDNQIQDPTALALVVPALSPSNNLTPVIKVDGVEADDKVRLFKDASCFGSQEIGSDIALGNSVDIKVAAGKLTGDGTYPIHVRTSDDSGNMTNCSTISLTYEIDSVAPPGATSVILTDPVTAVGTDTTPTFQVGGVEVGATVRLYSDSLCMDLLGSQVAATSTLDVTTDALPREGLFTVYASITDVAGNESVCSSVFANYTLDAGAPSLMTVSLAAGGGGAVVGPEGEIKLTFVATEPLPFINATIMGQTVTANLLSGTTYQAVHTPQSGDAAGTVAFSLDYQDSSSNPGPTITSTTDGSSVTFVDGPRGPKLSITGQALEEDTLWTYDVNDANTSNDTDISGASLTYSCFYDQVVDGLVGGSSGCDGLGVSVEVATGMLSWQPGFTDAGAYEFKVIATNGTLGAESLFSVNVANTNRLPTIDTKPDQVVSVGDTIVLQFDDTTTGSDIDVDGEAITYSCYYDGNIDGSVAGSALCENISGFAINGGSGRLDWTVADNNIGDYEIKVVASDGIGTVESLFGVTVSAPMSLKQINMVGTNANSYFSSLSDNNEVKIDNVVIGTYNRGDTFSQQTSAGAVLECSGGCSAITDAAGTALWSTPQFSATLLSTYMGRYTRAQISVVAFDNPAQVAVKQNNGTIVTASIPANSLHMFSDVAYVRGALWIESDFPVAAYIVTRSGSSFTLDGRVMTAADGEILAFVSGGGGTPSAVTTTADGTNLDAYRNDGVNFLGESIDITGIVAVTSSLGQNAAGSAIAVYADTPVVVTQHADGDGVNATPSLPKRMLPTHYVTPMDADYISFAAYGAAAVRVIDSTNTITATLTMTRNAGADAKAPYAVSYNISNIVAGTQFVCSEPCLAIIEPHNHDETLLSGTVKSPMSLTSSSFNDGDLLADNFVGARDGECSGANDFPQFGFNNIPWGTKALAMIVEDLTSGTVHLNLVDIDSSLAEMAENPAAAGVVTFATGTQGKNGYTTDGWSGPCQTTGEHTYQFKLYSLSQAIGSAVDNQSAAAFEAANAGIILGSSVITAKYTSP